MKAYYSLILVKHYFEKLQIKTKKEEVIFSINDIKVFEMKTKSLLLLYFY
jgi:hypothetical protein